MAFFNQQGRRIYYASFGAGKPLVFLHGITNSGRAWGPQIGPFTRAGYQVILPDLAGHGASSAITSPMTPAALADDILALIDFLGFEKVDCCGLSLGGMVAIEAANIKPQAFDRLILANTFVQTDTEHMKQMAEQWKDMFRQEDGPAVRLENTWPLLISKAFSQTDEGVKTFQVWHAQASMADGASYCHITDGLTQYNASDIIPTLSHRSLVLSSANDQISAPENGTQIAQLLPNSEHVTLEDSLHLSNVDQAEIFNKTVLDFLSS